MKVLGDPQHSQLAALRTPLKLCAVILASLLASCDPTAIVTDVGELCGQSTFVVTTTNEGTDPEQLCLPHRPCTTLRAALNTAAFCGGTHTVVLAAGATYTLTGANTASTALRNREQAQDRRVGSVGLPRIFGTVTIEGNGAIIERASDSNFRFFHVPPARSLTLRNVVLRQGAVPPAGDSSPAATYGGAVYNEGVLATESVTFHSNRALAQRGERRRVLGGAVYNAGTFTATTTFFESNLAEAGGALFNAGSATLSDSNFTHNNASGSTCSGSAIHHEGDMLTIGKSTFVANGLTTRDTAEALFVRGSGTVRIDQSTFSSNKGLNAGAIWAVGGTLTIQRSTFHGQSGVGAGAFRCDNSSTSAVFEDVTIAENASESESGFGGVMAASGCAVTFSNTLVALNTAQGRPKDCGFATGSSLGAQIERRGQNLDSDGSCGFTLTANPDLLPNPDGTPTLLPGSLSPAVNAGERNCLTADQRNLDRPIDRACDIGAVERQASDPG